MHMQASSSHPFMIDVLLPNEKKMLVSRLINEKVINKILKSKT